MERRLESSAMDLPKPSLRISFWKGEKKNSYALDAIVPGPIVQAEHQMIYAWEDTQPVSFGAEGKSGLTTTVDNWRLGRVSRCEMNFSSLVRGGLGFELIHAVPVPSPIRLSCAAHSSSLSALPRFSAPGNYEGSEKNVVCFLLIDAIQIPSSMEEAQFTLDIIQHCTSTKVLVLTVSLCKPAALTSRLVELVARLEEGKVNAGLGLGLEAGRRRRLVAVICCGR